jgi:hypothetical protein
MPNAVAEGPQYSSVFKLKCDTCDVNQVNFSFPPAHVTRHQPFPPSTVRVAKSSRVNSGSTPSPDE